MPAIAAGIMPRPRLRTAAALKSAIALLGVLTFSVSFGSARTAPGTWMTATPLPLARSEVSVAAIGSSIYVVGGYAVAAAHPVALDTTGRVDVDQPLVDAYDTATGRWSERAPLPRGLNHIGIAAFDGKLYTFGGFTRQNRDAVADANVYDPTTNRWSSLPPVPAARGSISVAVLDRRIHLVGGRDVHSVSEHDVFDPAIERYTSGAAIPVGRDHMGLVAYDHKLYAIGGRIDDFRHNTSYVDIYDPATDRWTSGSPMPSRRSGMGVAVYRDRIFAVGGEYAGGTFTNNEGYDPRSNSWSGFAPLPEGRHGTGAVVVGGRLYLPGGGPVNGGSRQSSTLYVFTLGS